MSEDKKNKIKFSDRFGSFLGDALFYGVLTLILTIVLQVGTWVINKPATVNFAYTWGVLFISFFTYHGFMTTSSKKQHKDEEK